MYPVFICIVLHKNVLPGPAQLCVLPPSGSPAALLPGAASPGWPGRRSCRPSPARAAAEPGCDDGRSERCFCATVASRSRTLAKVRYEPRVDILQHGYEYAPLNTAKHAGPTGHPRSPEPSHQRDRGGGFVVVAQPHDDVLCEAHHTSQDQELRHELHVLVASEQIFSLNI